MLFRPFTAVTYIVLMLLAGCAEPGGGNPTNVEDCREITRLRAHDTLHFDAELTIDPTSEEIKQLRDSLGELTVALIALAASRDTVLIQTITGAGPVSIFSIDQSDLTIGRQLVVFKPGARFGIMCAVLFKDTNKNFSVDERETIHAISPRVYIVSEGEVTCLRQAAWWQDWEETDATGVVVNDHTKLDEMVLKLDPDVDFLSAPWMHPEAGVIRLRDGQLKVGTR